MASSSPEYARPRHRLVRRVLDALDGGFLEAARCYFGGGTRIALGLDEYRESGDIDFLCSDREGYRALRAAVTDRSLGRIVASPLALAREVLADRYGIRTAVDVDGEKIKLEFLLEGRIAVTGARDASLGVPVLDAASCMAEKFLANADRWSDESVLSRDVIDLAFMMARWGARPAAAGYTTAQEAYGAAIEPALQGALAKVRPRTPYRRRCLAELGISDQRTLGAGLRALGARRWRSR